VERVSTDETTTQHLIKVVWRDLSAHLLHKVYCNHWGGSKVWVESHIYGVLVEVQIMERRPFRRQHFCVMLLLGGLLVASRCDGGGRRGIVGSSVEVANIVRLGLVKGKEQELIVVVQKKLGSGFLHLLCPPCLDVWHSKRGQLRLNPLNKRWIGIDGKYLLINVHGVGWMDGWVEWGLVVWCGGWMQGNGSHECVPVK